MSRPPLFSLGGGFDRRYERTFLLTSHPVRLHRFRPDLPSTECPGLRHVWARDWGFISITGYFRSYLQPVVVKQLIQALYIIESLANATM